MLICNECKSTFEMPNEVREYHDGRFSPPEIFYECPACGGSDFEELHYCSKCGEVITESQNKFFMCPACEENTAMRFKYFMDNEFDNGQRRYLNWKYESERRCAALAVGTRFAPGYNITPSTSRAPARLVFRISTSSDMITP